jgi:prevent-host-death family protein
MEELPKPQPISIRTARGRFGSLVDEVAAEGRPALICRRTTPLAVLLPADKYEELAETVRRDQSLAAIFRARGIAVDAWTTAGVLEAVVRLIEGPVR